MDTASNQKKGDALENSVKLIIEAVLESDPKYKGQKFAVQTKVRDMTSGVPNEIDVLVVACPKTEYESKFIFECKNWKEPAGKDVVQLFSKVVDEVRATRGFLVAKAITKPASDQILMEPRVSYIRCSDDFVSPLSSAELIHIDHEILAPRVTLKWRTHLSGEESMRLEPEKIACLLNGERVDFTAFISSHLDEMAAEASKEHPIKFSQEGTHWIGGTGRAIRFRENELVVDGHDVETIWIPFFSFVTCRRRRLVSKFELEGRGQAFSFDPVDLGDSEKPVEIQIVTRFRQCE
jgi:restriction endonuclease